MPKGNFLGEFELYVMLALNGLGPSAYGVTIRQEIEARTARDVSIGAVYATLSRLDAKGLVRFELSPPLAVQGGRARKCYALTAQGRRALQHSTSMLARMMGGWQPRTERP